jgi:hypothetical protein
VASGAGLRGGMGERLSERWIQSVARDARPHDDMGAYLLERRSRNVATCAGSHGGTGVHLSGRRSQRCDEGLPLEKVGF